MPGWSSTPRPAPFGMIFLLAVAAALYGALLLTGAAPPARGEDAFGQGMAVFMLTAWLWIVLAGLLVIGGVNGQMPRWAAVSALLIHPLSSVAAFVALDAVSRRVGGAILIVVLLPPLIAGYAIWARLPRLHDAYPAGAVSAAAWGSILILSGAGLLTGL